MCGINSTPVHAVYDKRSSDKGKKQQSGELLIGIDDPTSVVHGDLEVAFYSYSLLNFYDMYVLMISKFKLLGKNKKGAMTPVPYYVVDSNASESLYLTIEEFNTVLSRIEAVLLKQNSTSMDRYLRLPDN